MTKHIAKIVRTNLGWEDHGIFSAWIEVDYGVGSQGIGGYVLDDIPTAKDAPRRGTAFGMEWIIRFMRACGAGKWEDLKGKTIYVLKDSEDWDAKVIGVQNLPTEPGELFVFAELSEVHSFGGAA